MLNHKIYILNYIFNDANDLHYAVKKEILRIIFEIIKPLQESMVKT